MADIRLLEQLIDGRLSQQPRIIMAIDGPSGSGKTTLAQSLAKLYDANVYHIDDFYLSTAQRQCVDRSSPGWNADHERLMRELLEPLMAKRTIAYRAFNCQSQRFAPTVFMPSRRLEIIEGAYSLHPRHRRVYDLKIFMTIDAQLQKDRIRNRNGQEGLKRFLTRWIPLENAYFQHYQIADDCDVIC